MIDQLRKWLQPALDAGGNTHSFEDILAAVERGDMQLWRGPNGAAVTEVVNFPNKRVLHVFLAGGDMAQITDFQESAAAWARELGCDALTLSGRLGWQRALKRHGWRATQIIMELPLWQADFSAAARPRGQSPNG